MLFKSDEKLNVQYLNGGTLSLAEYAISRPYNKLPIFSALVSKRKGHLFTSYRAALDFIELNF